MKVRALEPQEYDRLKSLPDALVPDKENSIAVVAETEDKQLVGRMLLVVLPHIEGTWIADNFRSGRIGFQLERELEKEARKFGLKKIFAYTTNQVHSEYMERLGFKRSPWEVFEKCLQ